MLTFRILNGVKHDTSQPRNFGAVRCVSTFCPDFFLSVSQTFTTLTESVKKFVSKFVLQFSFL